MTEAEKKGFRFFSAGTIALLPFWLFFFIYFFCLLLKFLGINDILGSINAFFSLGIDEVLIDLIPLAIGPVFLYFIPYLWGRFGSSISSKMLVITGEITELYNGRSDFYLTLGGISWIVPYEGFSAAGNNDAVMLMRPEYYRLRYITEVRKMSEKEERLQGWALIGDISNSHLYYFEKIRIAFNLFLTMAFFATIAGAIYFVCR